MTSREIVQRAIRFERPPRLPVRFDALGVADTAGIPVSAPESFRPSVPGEDEWGCIWRKSEVKNMGQVKGHPLASLADVNDLPVPDYGDDSRYLRVPEALDRFEDEGKYVTADIFMVLFERMHSLFGFENTLAAVIEDPKRLGVLADRIADVHIGFVDAVGRRFGKRVHGFSMTDDWGTQRAAFIGFNMWMDFFFPRYRRIFDRMHSFGYDVWVHSCGKVNEIVEGYIRAGVDVINLQQPRALGIEEMGRRYRGRITFESLADIQATLPTGDRGRIDADVRDLAAHWLKPEGGFVFSDYGDNDGIGVKDPGVKRHMYEQFSRASKEMYGSPLPVVHT